jgi:integrase
VVEQLERFKAGASSLVFPSRRNPKTAYAFEPLFHAALSAAQIKNATFHTLRHTCASSLAESNASLLEIADVLGHRQLQMTKRYSHLTTGHKSALLKRVLGDVR